ncbi:MAG: WD40 repeat domain-containing protein, partial [Planctomycetota bacterium]
MDRELGDPSKIKLPNRVISKRERHGKSASAKKWNDLDLEALIAVVDEQFEERIRNKPAELKTCLKYMRHVRDYVSHIEGEPNIPELIKYTSILHEFLRFIDAPKAIHEGLDELERELFQARSIQLGVDTPLDASTSSGHEKREQFHAVDKDPFEQFERLLESHDEFIGRSTIVGRIREFISAHKSGTLILEASLGGGKSALIAQCVRKVFAKATPALSYWFYNRLHRLTHPDDCLRTLYEQLVKIHEIEQAERLATTDQSRTLLAKFERLLKNHVAPKLGENKQLIFIDALDEAGTDGELSAYLSLPWHLPDGVFVIASTRANMELSEMMESRKDITPLKLDDLKAENQVDAAEFVDVKLDGKSIDEATRAEISRLGAGNFCVLNQLCLYASESLRRDKVAEFLRRLAKAPDRLAAIYDERCWRRLPDAQLDKICEVAALILECRDHATDSIAVEVLDNGLGKWRVARNHLAEYLQSWPQADDSMSYSFKDQAFAEYLQTKLSQSYTDRANEGLATMCLRWNEDLKGTLRQYAVQFGPEHLCRTEKWSELERLLTDLQFVEEKFRLGMARSLAADYRRAVEQHPEWREESLTPWSEEMMKAGRCWRAELNKKWTSDDPDSVELPTHFPFPDPPATSRLRALLLNVSRGRSQHRNTHIARFQVFHAFVTNLANLLTSYPEVTLALAFNFSGTLAKQAEEQLTELGTPWFEEHPRPYVDPRAIPQPTLRVKATAFSVSDDGKRCVTGDENGELRFWDLTTGYSVGFPKSKETHDCEVTRLLLSVDGSRVISFGGDGSIAAHEFDSCHRLWRKSYSDLLDLTDAACSPEASIVATVGGDDEVHVIDGDTGEVLCKLNDPKVQGITNIHVVPERFEILVVYNEGDCATWDLRTVVSTASEIGEWEEADQPDDETTEPDEDKLFDFWNRGSESADGRIAARVNDPWGNGIHIYADDEPTTGFALEGDGGSHLVANGRVLWINTRDSLVEFNNAQFPDKPELWND